MGVFSPGRMPDDCLLHKPAGSVPFHGGRAGLNTSPQQAMPFHLDILDGKIWIQNDGTNRPIAVELERSGVPKEDIVLGFHSAENRTHTGYGVG